MVAIAVVSIITSIIFLIWVSSSLTRLSQVSLDTEVGSGELLATSIENISTFALLRDRLETILEDGMGIIDSIRGPIEYNSSDFETD